MLDPSNHETTLAAALALSDDTPAEQVIVQGAALDSRDVAPGDLFIAVPGDRANGIDHVADAAARGAVAIAWDGDCAPDSPLPSRHVDDLAACAGEIAARVYGHASDSLFVTGITGTDGKTTCAWLLATALSNIGDDCGYIGTLGAGRIDALQPTRHTTPDAAVLQRECAQLREDGGQSVAIETSSHGLEQGRPATIGFDVAVLTGIGRDHLDYHVDYAHYVAAKRRLFDYPQVGKTVISADDTLGYAWLEELSGRLEVTGYGVDPSVERLAHYVYIKRIAPSAAGLEIALSTHVGDCTIATRLVGFFNAANIAAVMGVLLAHGITLEQARDALVDIGGAPGRMERMTCRRDQPTVVVDYAHTAGALTQALTALADHCSGRLIVVFGCGGARDMGKRAAMGRAASAHADDLIVTNDNPRDESPEAIVAQIVADLSSAGYRTILDREDAIRTAIADAGPDDLVLIAGKGHETTQQVGEQLLPLDDRIVARSALEAA